MIFRRTLNALVACLAAALAVVGLGAAFLPETTTIIDASAYPIVGDGVFVNNSALQAIFTAAGAAPSGAKVVFPCGHFKYTAAPALSVANKTSVQVVGGGQECTVFEASGAINGAEVSLVNIYSSFKFSDMTFATDTASASTMGLHVVMGDGLNNEYSPSNEVDNVSFRGHDFFDVQSDYWGYGFFSHGVSNINIVGGICNSIPAAARSHHGLCYHFEGTGAGANPYSVVFTMTNVGMNQCRAGVDYGNWVQGVFVLSSNITGCDFGVQTAAGGGSFTTDILDQLSLIGNQFNTYSCAVCINDEYFNDLLAFDNAMIVEADSIGFQVEGTGYIIAHNQMGDVGNGSSTAFKFPTSSHALGGLIESNTVLDFKYMTEVQSTSNTQARIRNNFFIQGVGPTSTVVSGNVNTQAVTLTLLPPRTDASTFIFTAGASNSGAFTINDGNGPAGVYKGGTTALATGDVIAGTSYMLTWSAASNGYEIGAPQEYFISGLSSGTIIEDVDPKNYAYLPGCSNAIKFSEFYIADSNTGTFMAAPAGGGNYEGRIQCDGSTYHFH